MPLLHKFISVRKINKKNQDTKLPINITTSTNCESNFYPNSKSGLHFGVDQVRVLLFRECEWRGRKLLFDSVTAGKNTVNDNVPKRSESTTNPCPRNGNGLPQATEKDACDNLSLLSELVFGTVAMTYRGPLFKIHKLDPPTCIMCTKVFPASDHSSHRQNVRLSDETLGTCSTTTDNNLSNGSIRHTLSTPSSGNYSGGSLRKSSVTSSTCSGWDIDVPLLSSSQSLESNSSSGFGSFSSFRRRWLRAVSTSLNHTESDEIFGFQACNENSGVTIQDVNSRRHKTRLGLAVLIKLTPGEEEQMEIRLLEHAAQLEAMLNRLCCACMEPTRGKINGERKGLIVRLQQASIRCTLWLLRLLMTAHSPVVPSVWHDVLLNSSTCLEIRANTLYRSFQQMCQLLNLIDTKSTNFFLSTVVTAILTYHLGWVNTVVSSRDKTWMENIKKIYPCNPLWAQLGDLHGTIAMPAKLVHTVIVGDPEKATLINSVLTFLSYFIRSGIIKKHYETRTAPEDEVQKAVSILEKRRRKNSSMNSGKNSRASLRVKTEDSYLCSSSGGRSSKNSWQNPCGDSSCAEKYKGPVNSNIPRLKKTSSLSMNLNLHSSSLLKTDTKLPIKLESCQDDLTNYFLGVNDVDKNPSSPVKIIVSETVPDESVPEKNFPQTSAFDEFDQKNQWKDTESLSVATKLSFLHSHSESGFDTSKLYVPEETKVYYSQMEYTDSKQSQVRFTLGAEDKISTVDPPIASNSNCQCSFAFTRVPSTSAELPADVLRKILQRNFPESSKSIQRPPGTSFGKERAFGWCPKCNGSGNYEGNNNNLLLETPTNATEVLRTCGNSVTTRGGARPRRADSLDELLEANNVVEVPMPRSKAVPSESTDFEETIGFTNTLLQRSLAKPIERNNGIYNDSNYTPGLVIQGVTKRKGKRKNPKSDNQSESYDKNDLIAEIREEVDVNARFPTVDQPVSEALCILADVDTWKVGIISNNMPSQSSVLPVGMSRLVSDMLEAFVYLWTKYRSPADCLNILECKLREMWLRSEALAAMLMTTDACDVNSSSLMNALDLDAADIPLLLAVATTHSPQIAQRFGLTLT